MHNVGAAVTILFSSINPSPAEIARRDECCLPSQLFSLQ